MPAIDRSLDNVDFLSDDFRGAIRRRLGEIIGLVLIVLSVTLAAALGTWSVQDPSLSHATDAPVRNLLGRTGRDCVRSPDPAVRACRHCAGAAGRGLGLAADHASAVGP